MIVICFYFSKNVEMSKNLCTFVLCVLYSTNIHKSYVYTKLKQNKLHNCYVI